MPRQIALWPLLSIGLMLPTGTIWTPAEASAQPQAQASPALPAGLSDFPAKVIGVVGSGDQLGLEVRQAGQGSVRTLQIGDEFADGWTLETLDNAEAAVGKGDQLVRIGLNPTGKLAEPPPPSPPSEVIVELTPAQLARLTAAQSAGYWKGRPTDGLTLAETQRLVLYKLEIRDALDKANQDKIAAGKISGVNVDEPIWFDAASASTVLRGMLGDAAFTDLIGLAKRMTFVFDTARPLGGIVRNEDSLIQSAAGTDYDDRAFNRRDAE